MDASRFTPGDRVRLVKAFTCRGHRDAWDERLRNVMPLGQTTPTGTVLVNTSAWPELVHVDWDSFYKPLYTDPDVLEIISSAAPPPSEDEIEAAIRSIQEAQGG